MFLFRMLITLLLTVNIVSLFSQSRWVMQYYEDEDAVGKYVSESYDKGYFLVGKHGHNYSNYTWLIKTDINGEKLWEKTFGDPTTSISLVEMAYNVLGEIYLVGLTGYYNDESYDPLIIKLNACGEKQWCRVFIEDGINYSNALVITPDGGVVVLLMYMSTIPYTDRICLAKFDIEGNLQWKHCYNSPDSSISNQDAWNLTLAPNGGILITAMCGYRDPTPPHMSKPKPYYIMTDSLGIFKWEKVVHIDVSDKGGEAWSTVLSPDSNYFYSSISHYYRSTPYGNTPALLKMDLNGNVIDIFNLAPLGDYGKMFEAKFVTDTTIMASAVWGNSAKPKAVIIDTVGSIIHQTNLLDNEWMAFTEVTFDSKLLFFTDMLDENDQFDAYLFKLNQQLESDTLYTQLFNYDSLCPHQIVSDTIVQDNCGLIVGDQEIKVEAPLTNFLKIFPNPAGDYCIIEYDLSRFDGKANIVITDLYGRNLLSFNPENKHTQKTISLADFSAGIYFVNLTENGYRKESVKLIVVK